MVIEMKEIEIKELKYRSIIMSAIRRCLHKVFNVGDWRSRMIERIRNFFLPKRIPTILEMEESVYKKIGDDIVAEDERKAEELGINIAIDDQLPIIFVNTVMIRSGVWYTYRMNADGDIFKINETIHKVVGHITKGGKSQSDASRQPDYSV